VELLHRNSVEPNTVAGEVRETNVYRIFDSLGRVNARHINAKVHIHICGRENWGYIRYIAAYGQNIHKSILSYAKT
jgi:hypothetical protein